MTNLDRQPSVRDNPKPKGKDMTNINLVWHSMPSYWPITFIADGLAWGLILHHHRRSHLTSQYRQYRPWSRDSLQPNPGATRGGKR